jgi:hypothetical protein
MNIPDNSKFESMVSNRPPLSVAPAVNKRLISQYFGRNLYFFTAAGLFGFIFLQKFWINANSGPYTKSRKAYSFESDPYSGKVSCKFRDVPNYQHGY